MKFKADFSSRDYEGKNNILKYKPLLEYFLMCLRNYNFKVKPLFYYKIALDCFFKHQFMIVPAFGSDISPILLARIPHEQKLMPFTS